MVVRSSFSSDFDQVGGDDEESLGTLAVEMEDRRRHLMQGIGRALGDKEGSFPAASEAPA